MQNFKNSNFIDLLEFTKKSFFEKLGNKKSKKLEQKFKNYYLSKVKNNSIFLNFNKKEKIIFPYKKMGLITSVALFGYYEHLLFLIYYLKYEKYKIDSYEPDPKHLKVQKQVIKKNNCKNVKFINKGVYDSNGTKNFYRVLDNTAANYIEGQKNGYGKLQKIKIKTVNIKDISKKYSLIKMDAEGSEGVIIKGMTKQSLEKVDIICEISGDENAVKIFKHCKINKINIYSHKNYWNKIVKLKQMPTHHTQGLILITKEDNYFKFIK
jgi:FkbM family methyltransferase